MKLRPPILISQLCLLVVVAAAPPPAPRLVRDINQMPEALGSLPYGFVELGGKMILSVEDADHGRELWTTDGTEAGTTLLKDINPGATSSNPSYFTLVGSVLYFTADDGTHGREIWRTDGTAAGTVLAFDGYSGSTNFPASIESMEPCGSYLLFRHRQTGVNKVSYYSTDGTAPGTKLLNGGVQVSRDFVAPQRTQEFGPGQRLFMSGSELWQTDGTQAGTIRRFYILGGGQPTRLLARAGNSVFLAYRDALPESRLLKLDLAGTEIDTVCSSYSGGPEWIGNQAAGAGTTLFFTASDALSGEELWASDGTAAGTRRVRDIRLGTASSEIVNLTAIGNVAYFTANDGVHGQQLWRSDGTAAGTFLVDDKGIAAGASARLLQVVGNQLYLIERRDGVGEFLWKSDGTPQGTTEIQKIASPYWFGTDCYVAGFGSGLMILGNDQQHGWELWTSDGTPAGTRMLKDIRPSGTLDGVWLGEAKPLAIGKALYFPAYDQVHDDASFWRTTGTSKGTTPVPGFPGYPDKILPAGKRAYALSIEPDMHSLWSYPAPRGRWKKIFEWGDENGSMQIEQAVVVGDDLYFLTWDNENGRGFWKYTAKGKGKNKAPVKLDFGNLVMENPVELTAMPDGLLYFVASSPGRGRQIWKTNGTVAGTTQVSGVFGFVFEAPGRLTPVGNTLYFTYPAESGWLWKSDGTLAGTNRVGNIAGVTGDQIIIPWKNEIYFPHFGEGTIGTELWKSNGTEAGTGLLKAITPNGWQAEWTSRSQFAGTKDLLYFMGDDGEHGAELWCTDGTPQGTRLLADIQAGAAGSNPDHFVLVGERLYFSADDGIHGREFWTSDGSTAGTTLVSDLYPGPTGSEPGDAVNVGTRLYFKATTPEYGNELWLLDRAELRR